MKKIKCILKDTLSYIAARRLLRYSIIVIIILSLIGGIATNKYFNNKNYNKEKIEEQSSNVSNGSEELANGKTKTKLKDEKKKKREAEKEAKAIQLKIKNLEKTISEKEDELNNLQEQLCLESIYSNPSESQRVNNEIKSLEQLIANLYDEWESLA